MRAQGIVIGGVVLLIVLLLGSFFFLEAGKRSQVINTPVEEMSKVQTKSESEEKSPGKYITYDDLALTESKNIIFFAASWCPSCRSLDKSISSQLSSIPENITILKADYDKETALKKKYGVTYQHTLVQVDKEGNLIKKWSGSSSLSNLLLEVE